MEKQLIEKLIERATADEKMKLITLYNASVSTLKEYQSDNTASRLANWTTAEKAMKSVARELEQKYFSPAPSYKNIIEMVSALQKEGFRLKKSKAYKDAKAGVLRVESDGSVLEAEAFRYAANLKRAAVAVDEDGRIDEKNHWEIEKLKAQAEKTRFELEKERGKYLLKTDVRAEIAAKLGVMEAGFKHLVRSKAIDWIYSVGGDAKKANMLIDRVYTEIDEFLNELCEFDELQITISIGEAVNV